MKRIRFNQPAYNKFSTHKSEAKRRGIPFALTFQQWWKIWQDSGYWHNRGYRKGQYVMARFGDEGPYAVDNVRIATVEENHIEGMLGKKRSLETRAKLRLAAMGNQNWRFNIYGR